VRRQRETNKENPSERESKRDEVKAVILTMGPNVEHRCSSVSQFCSKPWTTTCPRGLLAVEASRPCAPFCDQRVLHQESYSKTLHVLCVDTQIYAFCGRSTLTTGFQFGISLQSRDLLRRLRPPLEIHGSCWHGVLQREQEFVTVSLHL